MSTDGDDEYYCSSNSNSLVPFVDSWKYKTLAECCYENFHWVKGWLIECIVKDFNQHNGLPCAPPPELSSDWYVKDENECVRECDEGDSCNGRAPNDTVLYSTCDECCSNHLGLIENSPCPATS